MPNFKAGNKFAAEGLPDLEPARRLVIKRAGNKGQGVFLKDGLSLEKGTYVMRYGGRLRTKNPNNDYTFKFKNRFLDASKAEYCKEAGAFHLCSFFF